MRRNRGPMAVLTRTPGSAESEGDVWARFLDANLDRFRRTVKMPIGTRLGCGVFGCVYESTEPWVVKLTRDPTEGDVWAYMAELLTDEELSSELDSFLRVKDVVRIRPNVVFLGEEMPVFGIVRESALPVLKGSGLATAATLRKLGITGEMLDRAGIPRGDAGVNELSTELGRFPPPVRTRLREFFAVLVALQHYRKFADRFHDLRTRLAVRSYGDLGTREATEEQSDEAFRGILDTIESMRGVGYLNQFGDEMGRTLSASLNADLVFRDLHLMNIGWRVHTDIDGDVRPPCMVILDPGAMHTPYQPEIRQVELLENGSPYRGR